MNSQRRKIIEKPFGSQVYNSPTLDDLRRVLTRYEGAVQEVEREGNEDELPELEAARAELMNLLQQCRVTLSD